MKTATARVDRHPITASAASAGALRLRSDAIGIGNKGVSSPLEDREGNLRIDPPTA
jgi:hypothetical protein